MVEIIIIDLVFGHLFAIICLVDCLIRRLIAFGLTKLLVLVVCSLVLSPQSFNHSWYCQMDAFGLSMIWLVGSSISRPVVGSISLDLNWLMLLVSFLQSFFGAIQDGIILLNDHASISDLYQDCLHTLQDHLHLLDLHLLWSPLASTMLQGRSVSTPAVTLLL